MRCQYTVARAASGFLSTRNRANVCGAATTGTDTAGARPPPILHVPSRPSRTNFSRLRQVLRGRPHHHLPLRVEPAAVARTIPRLLHVVPRDDAPHVRAV